MEADRTLVCGNANLLTAYIRARYKCASCGDSNNLHSEVMR